jgi:hypothetical protein
MTTSTIDLNTTINAFNLQIFFGEYSFNATHTLLNLPFIGKANPASTANITTYEYTLDGTNWETMTPSSGSDISSLAFTPTGASFTFIWAIKADIGDDIYNKDIYIRLQATSGSVTTILKTSYLYFEKTVSNVSIQTSTGALPDDYDGLPGNLLLEKAPKG